MKNNIGFVGMMGSGKTTIARELNRVLKDYTFVDIDAEIEKGSGKKISEIFLRFGEPRFRMLESEKIRKFLAGKKQIISFGGGAFEDEFNREIILKNCLTIYLKASPEEIFNRIKAETHRPLLSKNFSIERIKEILRKRETNYQKADTVIDTTGKSPYDIVVEILKVIRNG
ncbi:shikimate kinase [Spirochaetes bacterium]|uniref:Shikimate kinase n=1 Tax=Candidatus Scatousia excrementipullorum TaxID=2840936 RepID=A0A9D9DQG4_9BACT|nr:shikimate kinase [Candidatus Scatousia excrementipullorum]